MEAQEHINYSNSIVSKLVGYRDISPVDFDYMRTSTGIDIKAIQSKSVKSFQFDLTIPIPEQAEMIKAYLSEFSPVFNFEEFVRKKLNASTIKELKLVGKDITQIDLIRGYVSVKLSLQRRIERIHTNKNSLIINDNSNLCEFKSTRYIPDLRQQVMTLEKDKLADFIFANFYYTKIYRQDFKINIYYTGSMLVNFILLNLDKVKSAPTKTDDGYYVWGRYRMYSLSDIDEEVITNLFKER